MKKITLLPLLLLFAAHVNAQSAKNRADFDFLYESIQKLPSYKDQVKTNPRLNFKLSTDFVFTGEETAFDVFLKLYQLISPIRDNHLNFYSNRDSAFAQPNLLEIPKATIDSALLQPQDSVCGTYYAGKYQLLLARVGADFVGVIEDQGKYYTQFLLKPTTPGHFDLIGFAKGGVGYFLTRNVVYINRRLAGTPYKKYQTTDFISVPKTAPKYEFKVLEAEIAYLRLGSFYADNKTIAESAKFFEQIAVPKETKHLIVDIRNNGGGAYKTSKKFLDLIQRFNGRVHLLINNFTVSNAEQFTIDLMDNSNVTSYGENTRGTISYGSNYGTTVELPSRRFIFYPTDMKARKQDLPFESVGIKPQVNLDLFKKDWVLQVIDHIKRN